MPDLNQCTFTGRLGRDPEIQAVGGTNVARFSLAVDDSYKKKDGTKVDRTCWIECEAWGGTAGIVERYTSKGSRVAVKGNLQLDQWEDKASGQKRSKHKVRLDNFGGLVLLGDGGGGGQQSQPQTREIQNEAPRQPVAAAIDEDDLPF